MQTGVVTTLSKIKTTFNKFYRYKKCIIIIIINIITILL